MKRTTTLKFHPLDPVIDSRGRDFLISLYDTSSDDVKHLRLTLGELLDLAELCYLYRMACPKPA